MNQELIDYIKNCPLKTAEDNRIYKSEEEYREQLNEPEILQGDMLAQQVDGLVRLLALDENCEIGLLAKIYCPIIEYAQELLKKNGIDTYYPSVVDEEYVEVRTKADI